MSTDEEFFVELREVSATPLDRAATVLARAERAVDVLWREALTARDHVLSERFADVSRALQRAARLVHDDRGIG